MIKATNKRYTITLSKNQGQWLEKIAKQREITISKLISYILMEDIRKLYQILESKNKEDWERILRAAKLNLYE